jgi:hypothetical protein
MVQTSVALLLVGFLFTPMTHWALPDIAISMSGTHIVARGYFVVGLLARFITYYLIYTGFLLWRQDPVKHHREVFLIPALLLSEILVTIQWADPDFFSTTIIPYFLGYAVIRPICFAIAILRYQMFNINITKKAIIYSTITLMIGLLFFQIKNTFQEFLPALGFLTIFIVSVLFLPLSALTNYIAERVAPMIQTIFSLRQDVFKGKTVIETRNTLKEHFQDMWAPRKLVFVIIIGFFIEVLESTISAVISYPFFLSVIFIGLLFSVLDYIVEMQFEVEKTVEAIS